MLDETDIGYLRLCRELANNSDCANRKVGAVIVRNGHLVAYGINHHPITGGPRCAASCPRSDPGAPRTGDYDLCLYVHAEAHAIVWAGRLSRTATLYCTDIPCTGCRKLIHTAGIIRIVTPDKEWFGADFPLH